LSLSPNPSHLEAVDPVVEGMVRASQDLRIGKEGLKREQVIDLALPVLLHGDAAFAGQGIVMETLNLAGLKGYRTAARFTSSSTTRSDSRPSPEAGRSTIYSTDVARMTQLPIFHINGDDPEAAYRVLDDRTRLPAEVQQRRRARPGRLPPPRSQRNRTNRATRSR
jgi:2-oxoglutarate dehydrogenase E1 component